MRQLSRLAPRSKKIWIFGSYQNSFSDNSKYLYTHVADLHPEVRAIWITGDSTVIQHIRSGGGEAHPRWSVRGIFFTLRGKYWFVSSYISDINYYLSGGAQLFNLWHGVPLKKIEFDIENGPLYERFHKPRFLDRHVYYAAMFRRPEWVLSTSPYVSEYAFSSAFRVPLERCVALGYPRLDLFFWTFDERVAWVRRWGSRSVASVLERIRTCKRVYLYMPTWRDADPNFLERLSWDFKKLDDELTLTNSLLLLKLHPGTPQESLRLVEGLRSVVVMDARDDVYPILPESSALITDYSSVYFDYLLLERPIVFFAFDLDRYTKESRGFYHSFEYFSPGAKVFSADAITALIASPPPDTFAHARSELRKRLFSHMDGQASERIVHFVQSQS